MMNRLVSLFLAGAVGALGAGAAAQSGSNGTVAFVGVNVIPMDREVVLKDQTVVVQNGTIVGLGGKDAQIPVGATRVDAAGKFLIPALAEMHAHIPGGNAPDALIERTLMLYVVNGLGTIRGMLGHPRHLQVRDRANKGEILSPRIYTSGPSLNGNTIPSKEAAIEAVKAQKAAGYDFLKIHPGVTRDAFDGLAATAHEVDIPFAGHVPLDVGLHRALEARYRSIDHLDGYLEAMAKNPKGSEFFGVNLVNELDESKIPALVADTKKAGTWMVPTQVLMDNLMSDEDPADMAKRPEMKYALQPGEIQKWIAQKQGFMQKVTAADRAQFLAIRRKLLKALYDGGVPFALGSDAPQWWNVPGFSVHRELQSLVQAGLTPYQALRTGTVDVATYFGHTDAGTLGQGKRADVILLEANPLEDIRNSSRIAGVFINGRWLPKEAIQKLLDGDSAGL